MPRIYRRATLRQVASVLLVGSALAPSSSTNALQQSTTSPSRVPVPVRESHGIRQHRRRQRSSIHSTDASMSLEGGFQGEKASVPVRPLSPPFPSGLNGGTLITLPPEQTYGYTSDDNAILQSISALASSLSTPDGGDSNNDNSGSTASIPSSVLLPPRPISVWLPPTYDLSGTSRHPVMYVADGQNAIDDGDSWTGYSWRMAGALVRLAERGHLSLDATNTSVNVNVDPMPILVLLPSAEGDFVPGVRRRHLEYGDTSVPIAQAHADFVVQRVMPLINVRFRTIANDPAATSAIGTSMGGQASLHLMLRHPDKFGAVAALSPAFQPATIATVAASADILRNKTIYIDNGGDDEPSNVKVAFFDVFDHTTSKHWWNPGYFWLDTQLQPGIDAMRAALDLLGVEYKYEKFAGGRHNERAWAQRINVPLTHLFGG